MTEEADYARHIIQKHRVAIALAVIKNKPQNISLDDYLLEIREKLQPRNTTDEDIISVSFSSNDFNLDIDSDEINLNLSVPDINRDRSERDKTQQESLTGNLNKKEKYLPDLGIGNMITKHDNNITFEENAQNFLYYDSTERISQNGATDYSSLVDCNDNQEKLDKTISICDDDNAPQELNDSMDILEGFEVLTDNGDFTENIRQGTFANDQDSQVLAEVFTMIRNVDQDIEDLRQNINSQMTHCDSQQPLTIRKEELQETLGDIIDSQETVFYTMNNTHCENTQNYTHVSQSQKQNFVIDQHFIKNKEKNAATNAGINNILQSSEDIVISNHTLHSLADNSYEKHQRTRFEGIAQDVKSLDYYDHDYSQKDSQAVQYSQGDQQLEQHNSSIFESQSQVLACPNQLNSKSSDNEITNDDQQVFSDEEPAPTQDIVPFKIIEEMNKIKSSLNKRARRISVDGHSTDSGYRSDSQKSLRNSLHLSDNWLNQSGSSLLRYIVQSPLVATTQEINNEIAQVLGSLIDRLHADEKYPTFLEEILENIDSLLKHLHEGENDKDLPMQKDDQIQRLILLNKSVHIQKYTLSKITSVLEQTYTKLTDKDTVYELENIDEMENLSYIFHLLEIIISKYQKCKSTSSQVNSQSSQISDSFKRSSITDLWRKKWNLSKDTVNVKENASVCIVTRCREILNKLVVGCMDRYSLVAYSALQCFNMLQN